MGQNNRHTPINESHPDFCNALNRACNAIGDSTVDVGDGKIEAAREHLRTAWRSIEEANKALPGAPESEGRQDG